MSLLGGLRRLLHGSDTRRAADEEAEILEREADRARDLDDRLRREFGASADALRVGVATSGWDVMVGAERLNGHINIVGPSGAGKSYLAAGLSTAFLGDGLLVQDPKQETIALFKRLIADKAQKLAPAARDALFSRVVCIDYFSGDFLPKFQVLAPVAGLDPELHAIAITHLITTEADQSVGARQEPLLHRAVECLIRSELPLTVLPTVLEAPNLLDALAESYGPADLYRTTATRLRKESKDRILGLVSRVERILRMRTARLALGGSRSCLDVAALFDQGRIALVGTAAPHGSAEAGRFFSGAVWNHVAHAIRRRPNGSRPSHVLIDEFPTVLASAGAHVADSYEDILRLARSKGVYLVMLSQDMASVAKVSRSLPEVLKTNVHLHVVFRAADAPAWDFILPVTGSCPRPASAPWEEDRGGYLDRSAERSLLREELTNFPDRECLIADRRTGLPGVRMRTTDLRLDATVEDVRKLEAHAARAPEVAAIAELEAGAEEVRRRVEALLRGGGTPQARPLEHVAPRGTIELRRQRKGLDVG